MNRRRTESFVRGKSVSAYFGIGVTAEPLCGDPNKVRG